MILARDTALRPVFLLAGHGTHVQCVDDEVGRGENGHAHANYDAIEWGVRGHLGCFTAGMREGRGRGESLELERLRRAFLLRASFRRRWRKQEGQHVLGLLAMSIA